MDLSDLEIQLDLVDLCLLMVLHHQADHYRPLSHYHQLDLLGLAALTLLWILGFHFLLSVLEDLALQELLVVQKILVDRGIHYLLSDQDLLVAQNLLLVLVGQQDH